MRRRALVYGLAVAGEADGPGAAWPAATRSSVADDRPTPAALARGRASSALDLYEAPGDGRRSSALVERSRRSSCRAPACPRATR